MDNISKGSENKGVMYPNDDGISHSLIEGNKEKVQEGRIIDEVLNQGLMAFNPDMMFEQMVRNYANAEKMFGEKLLKAVSGYDTESLKRNLNLPEFQRLLKEKMQEKSKEMKKDGIIDKEGGITDKGFELASLTMFVEELEDLKAKGFGERINKEKDVYGEKQDVRQYRKHDKYKDIAIRDSIKRTIKRGRDTLEVHDLKTYERKSKGRICIVYGLDASGSMKGEKVSMCKRAGIALAYNAINQKDKVGLVVFGSKVEDEVYPTEDFSLFLRKIARIKAKQQTDIASTIKKAIHMFPSENITKHLVLITDAVPTMGETPKQDTMDLVAQAKNAGITISVIGIGLNKEGEELARKIIELGDGRLYVVTDCKDVDRIVLQDYYAIH